jgi:transcriptional regulator GlxA family with amidase domain
MHKTGLIVTSHGDWDGMSDSKSNIPRICLLAAPETSPSVLYGLFDVLHTVGVDYSDMVTGAPGPRLLDVKIVSAAGEPFRCFGNVPVEPHLAIDAVDRADVAIVCDMYTPVDSPPRGRFEREIAWLKRLHAQGAILASVCSGSLVLAEAGLLDGLMASGHWAYRDLFCRHYPQVRMQLDAILTIAGEGDRIVTSGGVTSWQDLALHLIARLCGSAHAISTAKLFLLSEHRDGQLPYAAMSRRRQQTDAVIAESQSWIGENYALAHPVAQMTHRSGLQARTFARRFLAATGYRPMEYVHALRIEAAKSLLETGPASVEEIGALVGYEDPASFRRLFKRNAGLTAAAYRRKFAVLGRNCAVGADRIGIAQPGAGPRAGIAAR